jgi:acetolactate synthase-1/2/3 large subunit
MTETLSRYIARTLAAERIDRFFLLTGGDQPLWIALDDHGIDQVLARSEASAVYMADAYAQASGQLAVVYGQAGPGAANVAAALADPYWSRTPVLSITGGTIAKAVHRSEYQELATASMFDAVTYMNVTLTDPERIVDLLPRLIATARTQGPVNLTIPKDMFGAAIETSPDTIVVPRISGTLRPDPDAIAEAAAAIRGFERPLLLVGTGAKRADVGTQVMALSWALGAPIALTPGGKGVVDESAPGVIGVVGRYASNAANRLAEQADGIVVIGSRAGGLATDGYRFGAPPAKVVHLDRDPASLLGQAGEGVRVATDLVHGLDALLEALSGHEASPSWLEDANAARGAWLQAVEAVPAVSESGDLSPTALFPLLNANRERIRVVADTGYMAAWTATLFNPHGTTGFLRANGSLGWALPAALGSQLAGGAQRTVCVTGDGGFGYHVGDLETAIRRGLAPIVLVLNNRSLAFEYHEQKYKWQGRIVPIVNDLTDLDHAAVARAFGWQGERVTTLAAFEDAFSRAMGDTSRPWLLDVIVDKESFAPVTNFDRFLERDI